MPRTTFEMYAIDPGSYREFWLENEWTTFVREGVDGFGVPCIAVEATADEIAWWSRAQASAQDALRAAEMRLVHDLGLRIVAGDRQGLRRGNGWRAARRRFGGAGLQRAFEEFGERLRGVDAEYRPVRELIETRIQQAAVRAREEDARLRAAEQRKAEQHRRFRVLAKTTRWSCDIDKPSRIVHILRADDSAMSIEALTHTLQTACGTDSYTVHWNEHDLAELARTSGVDFETWWRAVAPDEWVDHRTLPKPPRSTPSIGGHTSYGVGGHTGFGGHFGI